MELTIEYLPKAGEAPDASKHDKEDSAWYNKVPKIILSRTITEEGLDNTTIISDLLTTHINNLKKQGGKNILIFGSPGAAHSLLSEGLVNEI